MVFPTLVKPGCTAQSLLPVVKLIPFASSLYTRGLNTGAVYLSHPKEVCFTKEVIMNEALIISGRHCILLLLLLLFRWAILSSESLCNVYFPGSATGSTCECFYCDLEQGLALLYHFSLGHHR